MSLIRYILNHEKRTPDKTAIICGDVCLSYASLVDMVKRVAAGLVTVGIRNGDHILVVLNNSIEFVVTMLAVADIGAVLVPVSVTINARGARSAIMATDVKFILGWRETLRRLQEDSEIRDAIRPYCWITVGGRIAGMTDYSEWIDELSVNYQLGNASIRDEQDYILTMTSGSTGTPKPIVFTQGTKLRRSISAKNFYSLSDDDVVITTSPIHHSMGQRTVFLPLLIGGTAVIMPRFASKLWIKQVAKNSVTCCIAVSAQLELILGAMRHSSEKITSLRCVISAASPLKTSTKRRLLEEMNCDVHEWYGASEVGVITNLSPKDMVEKISTVGCPVPGVEVKVIDDKGKTVLPGQTGEIVCRSGTRFSRYYKLGELTNKAMANGWFHTSDLGFLDEDGYLTYMGRKNDMIITGGINVFPKDIEDVLNGHPAIAESVVIGIEDTHLGEAILAVVMIAQGNELDENQLRQLCSRELTDYQQPMAYDIVEDFPRTSLGKIARKVLAKKYQEYDATALLRTIVGQR